MYQWRKFHFFEDRTPTGPLADELKENLTCSTSGRGQIAFATENGSVQMVDRSLKLLYTFEAHKGRISQIQVLKQRNLLLTIGEEDGVPSKLASTTLKLWDMERPPVEGSSGMTLSCLRSLRIFSPKFPESRVTTIAVLEEAPPSLLIAIGLESGQVYTFRGDIARDKMTRARLSVDVTPITGLGVRIESRAVHLFVATTSSTNEFNLSLPNPTKHVLFEHGCDRGCTTMSDSQEFVLGRPEAVYFYDLDGRGPCWVFEGKKTFMGWFRGYLLAVTGEPLKPEKNVFNVYDLKNKLIAYSAPAGDVAHVICEWGTIMILTRDAKLKCIAEKDMGSKLDLLFKKNLYTVAINIVSGNQADPAAAADVMRKYGDHLYEKQDYDEAMSQYIRTIGQLEPSYVIQKFLDAQRIHNLTRYLEKLHEHERGRATADHTTLLLNCYTKLKDVEKLDAFIKGDDHRFDVETAVRVCRAAGYHEQAMYLAKRSNEHEWYLKILLEDLGRYDEALKYISGLPTVEAANTLKQYGKILIRYKPGDTTEELLHLCIPQDLAKPGELMHASTSSGSLHSLSASGAPSSQQAYVPRPMEFARVFVDRPIWLMRFLEKYTAAVREPPGQVEILNTLLELYLFAELRVPLLSNPNLRAHMGESRASKASSTMSRDFGEAFFAGAKSAESDEASVSKFMTSDAHAEGSPLKGGNAVGRAEAAAAAAKTEETKQERAERLKKALALLKNGWQPHEDEPKYDVDLALVLCQLHGFREGQLFVYEKMKLYKEVMAIYMQEGDTAGLIQVCKRLADVTRGGDPNLWADVLSYFGERGEDVSKEVKEVLQHIERDNLLPPLIVLQTLANNRRLTLGVVKDYIARQMAQDTKLINNARKDIAKYQDETTKMWSEVHELRTTAQIFQASRCSTCTFPLDLPAVHFLCMHSFHQRCLGDNENECPICAPANRTVMEMKRSLERSANDHDRFFQLVQNSDDGFSVIAEYFGRGILNKNQHDVSTPRA